MQINAKSRGKLSRISERFQKNKEASTHYKVALLGIQSIVEINGYAILRHTRRFFNGINAKILCTIYKIILMLAFIRYKSSTARGHPHYSVGKPFFN